MSATSEDGLSDNRDAADTIEVGATEGTLRLWKAREAVRHGELRLAAQAAIRTALEARATALTGWSAVGLLATTAGLFTSLKDGNVPGALGSGAAAFVLLLAGAGGIYVARPRAWNSAGYAPEEILDDPWQTEMETLEAIAGGLGLSISKNDSRLDRTGRTLRTVGLLLTLAPVAGAMIYALADPITFGWTASRSLFATWLAWVGVGVGLVSSP